MTAALPRPEPDGFEIASFSRAEPVFCVCVIKRDATALLLDAECPDAAAARRYAIEVANDPLALVKARRFPA